MGLLDRLRASSTPARVSLPVVAVNKADTANDGTKLWQRGYIPVDPTTSAYLTWDAPELRDVGACICRVAGVSFRAEALQRDEFSPGRSVVLRPEPDNRHDRNAVAVFDDGARVQVGYLPREIAPSVASQFKRRRPLGGLVLQELREGGPDGQRVALVLVLCPIGSIELLFQDDGWRG